MNIKMRGQVVLIGLGLVSAMMLPSVVAAEQKLRHFMFIGEPLGLQSLMATALAIAVPILLLLALCFVVGALIRSRRVGLSFEQIETSFLSKVPGYDVVGNVLNGFAADEMGVPPPLDPPETLRSLPSATLTPEALAAITEQVRVRVLRWFARSGLIEPDDFREMLAHPDRSSVR
jgi:hypothetical protein